MLQCKTKWKKEHLKNILEDSYAGGTPNRSREDFYGGTIPWVTSGEVNQSKIIETNEYITDLGYKNSSAKMIPKNTVLLAMYGATAGQVSMLKIPATSNQAVLAIIPCKELDKNYLYHNLRYFKERILFSAQGSGQTNLSKELVEKYKITFPTNTEEQAKIADILSTCDEVIEKTEETIEKYKQIKAGMMQDLFTRGLDENGKLRPTYTQAPDLYKYSKELDRHIPKEWDVKRLDEIGEMKSGDGITAKNIFITGIYPVYGGNGLRGYTSNYTHEGEYVLIGRQGALCGNINKASGKFFASEHAVVVTLYDDNNVDWVFYKYTDLNLNQYSEASAQPGLSVQKISKIKIDIPKGPEQKNISIRLNLVDKKIKLEAEYLNKYKQIKQGLMKRLLTPPADAEIVEE